MAGNDAWAVGEYLDGSGPNRTLAEHWNGTSWSVVPSPNGYLYGVAAVTANDVWAVGTRQNSTLIAHYNDGCSTATVTPTNSPTELMMPVRITMAPVSWFHSVLRKSDAMTSKSFSARPRRWRMRRMASIT